VSKAESSLLFWPSAPHRNHGLTAISNLMRAFLWVQSRHPS
jgi:hypothetical protein